MANCVVRRFCFTLNNFTEEEYEKVTRFIQDYCKYGIVGNETAPTTGTIHLPGFCNLTKGMRFNNIKSKLATRIHLEKANGTDEQNQIYCRKSGTYFEKGTPVGQGKRTDLVSLVEGIQNGQIRLSDIAKDHPIAFIKYHRGIREYLQLTKPVQPRMFKTWVYYYWGPTGSGKSSRALKEAMEIEGEIYYKPRGLWWDGYHQQDNVIIDDFYGWIKYDEMLKIMDRYPYKVQVKGGFEEFTSRRIWITSNVDTDQLYKFIGYVSDAFDRRITNKVYID
ncbi:replication-associated protein [Dragonfly associated cyclovirus 5]|uniref:Replication-associated protein n=1 Tax=Dragonfly associated cyclovirus 5 TaxID=1234883 RepID=K0A0Z6_9CIRC|nr:replication-associated protein [Dragonfly associated cyclovirus 5]AFS65279.1 replication-associated protein [Dragonfly associated cyclovirus 5]